MIDSYRFVRFYVQPEVSISQALVGEPSPARVAGRPAPTCPKHWNRPVSKDSSSDKMWQVGYKMLQVRQNQADLMEKSDRREVTSVLFAAPMALPWVSSFSKLGPHGEARATGMSSMPKLGLWLVTRIVLSICFSTEWVTPTLVAS